MGNADERGSVAPRAAVALRLHLREHPEHVPRAQ